MRWSHPGDSHFQLLNCCTKVCGPGGRARNLFELIFEELFQCSTVPHAVDDSEDRRTTKYLDYQPIVEWPEMKGAPLLDFSWSRKPKSLHRLVSRTTMV